MERTFAKPFVKWAGGKTKLLLEIMQRLPKTWKDYLEPFVGGGAVFFGLASTRVGGTDGMNWVLNDINAELINAYKMVRDAPNFLIAELKEKRFNKKTYYAMRNAWNPTSPKHRAVRFIYLNKTCFNGLYRVNSKGEFNVPMGDYKNPMICDEETIRECSRLLQATSLHAGPFTNTIALAQKKDFIYCDPPYLPRSETAEFTSYTKDGFTISDHEKLHEALKKADKRGAFWMLSEGDSPFIRKLFRDFNVMPVSSRHSVSASGDSRTKSKELLITNYGKKDFLPWHVIG